MNRNFERAFELKLIPSGHKTISISLTNQNPDFLKPLMISIDTFGLWEAEHPNLVLSTYYPNIPQFDHITFMQITIYSSINHYKSFQLHKRCLVSSCFISNCKFQMTRCKNGSRKTEEERRKLLLCDALLFIPSLLLFTNNG